MQIPSQNMPDAGFGLFLVPGPGRIYTIIEFLVGTFYVKRIP